MKFVVAVDCEGVACAVGTAGSSLGSSPNLEFVRRQATREAAAAARGLFAAGADQVIVWDNHGGSLNLDYDALDERCDVALGTGFEHRFPGLDGSFARAHNFAAADDNDARVHAERYVDGYDVELWRDDTRLALLLREDVVRRARG